MGQVIFKTVCRMLTGVAALFIISCGSKTTEENQDPGSISGFNKENPFQFELNEPEVEEGKDALFYFSFEKPTTKDISAKISLEGSTSAISMETEFMLKDVEVASYAPERLTGNLLIPAGSKHFSLSYKIKRDYEVESTEEIRIKVISFDGLPIDGPQKVIKILNTTTPWTNTSINLGGNYRSTSSTLSNSYSMSFTHSPGSDMLNSGGKVSFTRGPCVYRTHSMRIYADPMGSATAVFGGVFVNEGTATCTPSGFILEGTVNNDDRFLPENKKIFINLRGNNGQTHTSFLFLQ